MVLRESNLFFKAKKYNMSSHTSSKLIVPVLNIVECPDFNKIRYVCLHAISSFHQY